MKESEYELLYLHCLSLKCPLETKLARSLGGLSQKGVTQPLEKFADIKKVSKLFLQYCNEKGKGYFLDDIEDYLAWKIWQHKIQNPNGITNPFARTKAQLINDKAFHELHKSASRIKRGLEEAKEIIANAPTLPYLTRLNNLLTYWEAEASEAAKTYNAIIENHNLALHGIDSLIVNQLEGN